jgi:hypothetical protein
MCDFSSPRWLTKRQALPGGGVSDVAAARVPPPGEKKSLFSTTPENFLDNPKFRALQINASSRQCPIPSAW